MQISAKKGIDIRFVDNLIFNNNSKITISSGFIWIKKYDSTYKDECGATSTGSTGIQTITASTNIANNNVYDLSGRVVKTNAKAEDLNCLKKGIYIYNNKKYIAK